jgi:hypothetical protein
MQAEAKETMRLVHEATGLNYSAELYADTTDLFGTEMAGSAEATLN